MITYEIRINGIGDCKAIKVKARSKKMALEKVKEIKGIPAEQHCFYMCRILKRF